MLYVLHHNIFLIFHYFYLFLSKLYFIFRNFLTRGVTILFK
jgi:hypothetical protein